MHIQNSLKYGNGTVLKNVLGARPRVPYHQYSPDYATFSIACRFVTRYYRLRVVLHFDVRVHVDTASRAYMYFF